MTLGLKWFSLCEGVLRLSDIVWDILVLILFTGF